VVLVVGWLALWVGGRGTAAQDKASTTPSVEREITEILETQRDAWNRGDLNAFLVPYWKSVEVTPLGTQSAMVLGNWKLTREAGPVGGNFTLVVQRHAGEWKIIHDHTSRRME